jgi:hypothetical protein
MTQIYMSFCDPKLPQGSQFLGALVLEANNVEEGAMKAHALGLNPGGEVLGVIIPEDKIVPEEFCGRLLNKDEARDLPIECIVPKVPLFKEDS